MTSSFKICRIENPDQLDDEQWTEVLAASEDLPYFNLPDIDLRQHALTELAWIKTTLLPESDNGLLIAHDSSGRACGLLPFRFLRWDTAHFGHRCFAMERLHASSEGVGLALLHSFLDSLAHHKAELVYLRIPTHCTMLVRAACSRGFSIMDTSLEFFGRLKAPRQAPEAADIKLRDATKEDVDRLARITRSYTRNRFHCDPRFDKVKCYSLYESWIRNEEAREDIDILVAEFQGNPVGFFSYQILKSHDFPSGPRLGLARLGIVAPEQRRRGVIALLTHGIQERLKANADLLLSSTLVHNYGMQRNFAARKMKIYNARYTLHGWFN